MTDNKTQTTIVYTDPHYFDGDPYEVAEKAVRQAGKLSLLLDRALKDADNLARNAALERCKDEPEMVAVAAEWEESPYARQFAWSRSEVQKIVRRLGVLSKAVSYNPKKPPRE